MQVVEAEELEKQLYIELENTGEDGGKMAALARHVMEREAVFVKWKYDGAAPFERSPAEPTRGTSAKAGTTPEQPVSKRQKTAASAPASQR